MGEGAITKVMVTIAVAVRSRLHHSNHIMFAGAWLTFENSALGRSPLFGPAWLGPAVTGNTKSSCSSAASPGTLQAQVRAQHATTQSSRKHRRNSTRPHKSYVYWYILHL